MADYFKRLLLITVGFSIANFDTFAEDSKETPDHKKALYLYIDEVLLLDCTVKGTSANDLRFVLISDSQDDKEIPRTHLQIIGEHTLHLNRTVTSEQDAGTYKCLYQNQSIYSQTVGVQFPPQSVTDVSCIVYDWDNHLNCTWNTGLKYFNLTTMGFANDVTIQAELNAMYSPGSDPCPHSLTISDTKCSWDEDNFRAADQYILTVTVNNRVKNESASTQIDVFTNKIIKPSPIGNLKVTEKNSTCVSLNWTHERKHRNKIYQVSVSMGQVKNTTAASITLCGCLPYTDYEFSVVCYSEEDGFGSDPVSMVVTTEEAAPLSSFPVYNGSYVLHPCSSNGTRSATVYWKTVPANLQNGKISGYQLIIGDRRIDVDAESPTSAVVSDVPCNDIVSVQIFAKTKAGVAQRNSRLTILPEVDSSKSFEIEMIGNELLAKWEDVSASVGNIESSDSNHSDYNQNYSDDVTDNVTIFWCPGNSQQKECQGEIQWKSAYQKTGALSLPIKVEEVKNYIYGISTAGKAIMWTDCWYSKDQVPKQGPTKVQVLNLTQQLQISWNPLQCSYDNSFKIVGYRLNICENHKCDVAHMIDIDGASSNNIVVNATPDVDYKIIMQALLPDNKTSPESKAVYGRPKALENATSYTRLFEIIISVFAIAMAILIGVLYICKKWKEKEMKFKPANFKWKQAHRPHLHQAEEGTANVQNPRHETLLKQPDVVLAACAESYPLHPVRVSKVSTDAEMELTSEQNQISQVYIAEDSIPVSSPETNSTSVQYSHQSSHNFSNVSSSRQNYVKDVKPLLKPVPSQNKKAREHLQIRDGITSESVGELDPLISSSASGAVEYVHSDNDLEEENLEEENEQMLMRYSKMDITSMSSILVDPHKENPC